jgi:hypothetical protein
MIPKCLRSGCRYLLLVISIIRSNILTSLCTYVRRWIIGGTCFFRAKTLEMLHNKVTAILNFVSALTSSFKLLMHILGHICKYFI